jgi:ribosomal protein L4
MKLINKLDCSGYVLVVTDNISQEMNLASRNIPNVKLIQANYLNVARILDADNLVISKPALEIINQWLGSNKANKQGL